MIANLMMYQRAELVEAHNRFWELIRQELKGAGVDSPQTLSQEAEEFFVWTHPDLVLSQTAKQLRVLEWTSPTPGLPLITAKGQDRSVIFAAVTQAIDALTEADRASLGLRGLVEVSKEAYLRIPNPPDCPETPPNMHPVLGA